MFNNISLRYYHVKLSSVKQLYRQPTTFFKCLYSVIYYCNYCIYSLFVWFFIISHFLCFIFSLCLCIFIIDRLSFLLSLFKISANLKSSFFYYSYVVSRLFQALLEMKRPMNYTLFTFCTFICSYFTVVCYFARFCLSVYDTLYWNVAMHPSSTPSVSVCFTPRLTLSQHVFLCLRHFPILSVSSYFLWI